MRWVATNPVAVARVLPGDPQASTIIRRMSLRAPGQQMRPVGTELIDDTGIAAVAAWIESLTAVPE